MNKTRSLIVGASLGVFVPAALLPSATASPHLDSLEGMDQQGRSILRYSAGHSDFKLRVWVLTSPSLISNRYSIRAYDGYGQRVWAANNQSERVYAVGANIAKIVLSRNSTFRATTHWSVG